MRHLRNLLPAVLLACVAIPSVDAANWPSWRGPTFDGVAPEGDYPTQWSESENIIWTETLPGFGGSTPAVWGDSIFVTSPAGGQNTVICLDRTGRVQWRTPIGKDAGGKHKKGSGSNPSPVTDGEHVYTYFRSGDLVCLDYSGNVVWKKQHNYDPEEELWWDLGTSPVLTDNAVVVAMVISGPSYLVAYDKDSGEMLWKQDRNLDAPQEANQSYSTPLVTTYEGRQQIIVLGADHVTAHDAESGKELWRVGGLNPEQNGYFRSIASPVMAGEDIVIAPYARGNTLTAIKMGGRGDVTDSHVLWTESLSADVPTPASDGDRVYVLTDKGTAGALDARTGERIWTQQLERGRQAFSASPVVTEQHVYLTRENGTTYVLNRKDGKPVATNNLDSGFTVSTPVFVDGRIYLRAGESLHCIGEGK